MIESKKITNPFPGLRPFETNEHRLFFGREGQSDALIARLQHAHFLAVVGTSGSGKSSLVRAGLLPALRGGMMGGEGSGWRIAIMRPGSDPIGNLALALVDKEVLLEAGGGLPPAEAEAVIEATLRRGSLGLVEAARQARLAENEKLLVIVDQFEELFRFRAARAPSSTGDDASAFVKLLLEASQQQEVSIYVVPTMRSDFLGDCAQFQGLPEAINDGQYLIPRMTRDERRVAITGPVGVTRGKIAEPLVNRLMNDVGDNPDQLPILQHALMRTWYYWDVHRSNGEPIALEHYEAIGTMSDALSKHADEAFEALPEGLRPVAESLFKTLTERGADNREIRRPTRLKDICEIAGASAQEVGAVINIFRDEGCSFLMPPAGVELQPETIIDISHESLIRNWRRLQGWVRDEAESARIYRRLAEAAMDYHAGARGLLDDVTLHFVLNWREKSNPDPAWGVRYHPEFGAAMGYLEESRAARDARLAAEHERSRRELETAHAFAEKQARAARRMRWLSVALGFIMLLALGTAVYAFSARSDALRSRKAAEESAHAAEAGKRQALVAAAAARRAEEIALGKTEEAKASEKAALEAKGHAAAEEARAEKEAVRANEQAQAAAKSEEAAKRNYEQAENNRKLAEAALERSSLIRRGLEDLGSEDYAEALKSFDCLSINLEALVSKKLPLSEAVQAPCKQRTSDKNEQLQLAWVYSKRGSTYSRLGKDTYSAEAKKTHYSRALEDYTRAVAILKKSLQDEHPDLLNAYHGLGQAYRDVGSTELADEKKMEDYKKAEEMFGLVLGIQEKHIAQVPYAAAVEHVILARLYRDMKKDNQAIDHFIAAARLWVKQIEPLNGRRDDELKEVLTNREVLVLRELARFYLSLDKLPDAEKTYEQIINIQENYDLSRGREIADSYSEVGQIYQARNEGEKAKAAFRVANLLQQATLKYLRGETEPLCKDMVKLAPVYVKLDRYVQVRQAYDIALYKSECMLEKAGEAENLLNQALIKTRATSPANWEEEDAIYSTLINIKALQKKETEIDQIYERRLENMTKRSGDFKERYARTSDMPQFTAAYVRAAGDVAGFYDQRKKSGQAEAAYRLAFNAMVAVKELSDPQLLYEYTEILSAYRSLLLDQKKPDEAATVEKAIESIEARRHEVLLPEQPEQTPQNESPPEPTPTAVARKE